MRHPLFLVCLCAVLAAAAISQPLVAVAWENNIACQLETLKSLNSSFSYRILHIQQAPELPGFQLNSFGRKIGRSPKNIMLAMMD
ncbi:MAG: hypothetical protein ACQET7_13265 [Thermodesulfobacteriota bacterium]